MHSLIDCWTFKFVLIMADFNFDEFMNTVNNIKANNELSRNKQVVRLTLNAMNNLCPNSYMPFLFIHAIATYKLEFTEYKKNISIHQNLIVSYEESLNLIYKSNYVKTSLSNLLKMIKSGTGNGKVDNSAYMFSDVLVPFSKDTNKGYWKFDGISKNALKVMEKHDSFFSSSFDKGAYLGLIDVLKYYMPQNPDNEEHYFDESFYLNMQEWIDFFDNLIIEQYKSNHLDWDYVVPDAITRIINGLFMDAGKAKLYDPFGHLGTFALNVNPTMSEVRELKTPICFLSDVKEDDDICATNARLLFHDERTLYNLESTSKNDINAPTYLATIVLSKEDDDSNPIEISIEKGLECVKNGGKMACVIPSSVLINKNFEDVRKLIVDTDFETKLVLLPAGCFMHTGISVTIIFINGKVTSDKIKFIDASNYVTHNGKKIDYLSISNLCYHDYDPRDGEDIYDYAFQFSSNFWSELDDPKHMFGVGFGEGQDEAIPFGAFSHDIKITLKEEIRQNDYSLNPSFYFDHTILAPEGYESKNLAEVLSEVVEIVSDNGSGKIISARDLHSNDVLIEIDPKNLTSKTVPYPGGTLIYKLEKGAYILVSKVGNLSPTAIRVSDTVYVNHNSVSVYLINDKNIVPAYLASEMRKNYFIDQLHYSKMVQGMMNKLILSVLNVFIPRATKDKSTIELQQEVVEKTMLAKIGAIGEQLKSKDEERFNNYILALRQRKHRLSQILNQVCPAFNLLNRTRERNNGILQDTDIVASRTGENVAQYFRKVQAGLGKIERLIETFVDKNNWGVPEKISIDDFVKFFADKHICKNYKIMVFTNNNVDIEGGGKDLGVNELVVNMPKDELSTVLENIIANAEIWGFTDINRTDYTIRVDLRLSDDTENVSILISNNGNPIHPSVDRDHIFDWGVGSHTGVGTWQAKNIVEHYGGHITINEYPKAKDGFQTEYEITLPREY